MLSWLIKSGFILVLFGGYNQYFPWLADSYPGVCSDWLTPGMIFSMTGWLLTCILPWLADFSLCIALIGWFLAGTLLWLANSYLLIFSGHLTPEMYTPWLANYQHIHCMIGILQACTLHRLDDLKLVFCSDCLTLSCTLVYLLTLDCTYCDWLPWACTLRWLADSYPLYLLFLVDTWPVVCSDWLYPSMYTALIGIFHVSIFHWWLTWSRYSALIIWL